MTIATPTRAEELADLLGSLTPEKASAMAADGTLKGTVEEYAKTFIANDADAARQVREETQAALATLLKENGYDGKGVDRLDMRAVAAASAAADRGKAYNVTAPGARMDQDTDLGFKSPGEFLTAIWHKNKSPEAEAARRRIENEYTSEVGSDGGFLIPESMRSDLMTSAVETSFTRPRAVVLPMTTKTLSLPRVEDTNHVGSIYGGLVAYWAAEGATVPDTNVKFGVTKLEAKDLRGESIVPNQLLQDSMLAFDSWIRQTWGKAMAWFEDADGFVDGDGVGKPLGWAHPDNGAMVTVPKETNQPADTITWENIIAMYSRMLPSSLNRAVWYANSDTFPQLATMALAVGTGGGPVWMPNGVQGPPLTLLGRPIVWCEHMETLGDAGDLVFADLSYYAIGDRMAMTVESSEHANWREYKTNFRIIQRADGRPLMENPVTPRKSAKTLSPFVRLAARA